MPRGLYKEFDGMESSPSLCCNDCMYEDYKPFKIVSVLHDGRSVGITSAYDAAAYMVERWPDEDGPKVRLARSILYHCLAGRCSAAVARVAFIEAAKEVGIFIETAQRPPPTGKVERWGRKRYPRRRS